VSSQSDGHSEFGIKVYVEDRGQRHAVTLGPARLPALTRATQSPEHTSSPPSSLPQSISGSRERLGQSQQALTNAEPEERVSGGLSAWTLLKWAALSCEVTPPDQGGIYPLDYAFVGDPWHDSHSDISDSWYIFHSVGTMLDTCDDVLYREEVLLCAADRLAEIGDSATTIYWQTKDYNETQSAAALEAHPIKVTIPPQATKDRFIARDVALNVLGHLARLVQRGHVENVPDDGIWRAIVKPCGDFFAEAANDGSLYSLVTSPYYAWYADPTPTSLGSTTVQREIGRRRVDRTLNLLSAAARLTKDLVQRSVSDDISGAQKQFGNGGDARAAALRAWGLDSGEEPYNNLRHALRTLYGRLESGSLADLGYTDWIPHYQSRDDPRCYQPAGERHQRGEGVRAADLITDVKFGMDGRWLDIAPSTSQETFAVSVLSDAGVVLPTQIIDDSDIATPMSTVRSKVQEQLVRRAAERANQPYSMYSGLPEADAVRAALSVPTVSDGALRFGLDRIYDQFRLLAYAEFEDQSSAADYASALRASAASSGLAVRMSTDASEIEALGGIVLAGPVPRIGLQEDVFPRLARAQLDSNCGVFPFNLDSSGLVQGYRAGALSPSAGDITAMQNVFLLGDSFRRTMLHLRAGLADDQEDLKSSRAFASVAAAEVRKWSGPGVVVREDSTVDDTLHVYLIDITPEDLGAQDDDDLAARLVLTSADFPYRAACLAGTRPRNLCPDSLFAAGSSEVILPLPSGVVHDTSYPNDETYVRRLDFPLGSQAVQLVLRGQDGKPGRVLATLPYTSSEFSMDGPEFVAEAVSDLQRELTERAFGVGREATPERTCTTTPPLALPRNYCIAGMLRDEFVPLSNELNGGGNGAEDSWKHYLDLAEAAAAKADEIAHDLIATGLQTDIRQEAASEEVAELCGTYPVDATATSGSDGQITTRSNDQAIQNCLKPPTVDITFLSSDPLGADAATNNSRICGKICDELGLADRLPFCSKCASGDEISHAGLGFTDAPRPKVAEEKTDPLAGCKQLAGSINFETTDSPIDFPKLSSQVRAPWFSEASLVAATSNLYLVENPNRGWSLSLGKQVLVQAVPDDMGSCTLEFPYAATDSGGDGIMHRLFKVMSNLSSSGSNCHARARNSIEAAIFYLGAMAGGIPAGRITLPVIATNAGRDGAQLQEPIYTYSSAGFEQVADNWLFKSTGYQGFNGFSLHDSQLMPVVAVGATPASFFADRSNSLALFLSTVRSDSLLALPTSNSFISFGNDLVGGEVEIMTPDTVSSGEIPEQEAWTANNSRQYLAGWVEDVARAYQSSDSASSGPVVNMVQTAAWQKIRLGRVGILNDSDGTPVSNVPNPLFIGSSRSICTHAYVRPVFEKYLDGLPFGRTVDNKSVCAEDVGQHVGLSHCIKREGIANGHVDAFTAASVASETDAGVIHLWETVGREGGPAAYLTKGGVRQDDWTSGPPPGCSTGCVWNLGHDRLLPTQCSPSERVELQMTTELPNNEVAMKTVVQALTLACVAENTRRHEPDPTVAPPAIQSMDDLRYLESWLEEYALSVRQTASLLFVAGVPKQVVDNVQTGTVGVGAVSQGEQGKLFLELEDHLRTIGSSLTNLAMLFRQVAAEIKTARLQIEAAQLEGNSKELQLALRVLENDRELTLAAAAQARAEADRAMSYLVGFVETVGGAATGAAGVALDGARTLYGAAEGDILDHSFPTDLEIKQDFGAQVAANLKAQAGVSDQTTNNQIALVLGELGTRLPGLLTGIADALTATRNHTSDAQQVIVSLKQLQNKSAVALGKAAGADFISTNGQTVPLHVNTVYRRQFAIEKARYERALESAKRAAYLARLAIEERLGVRLADLRAPVGPLAAPAGWVDDVCTVQGVDYESLRTATPGQDPSGAAEADLLAGFADQYVGDYVAKLRELVEFYNVENPFKEGADTALLSLRETLGDSDSRCLAESKNLLFYSDQLDVRPDGGEQQSGDSALGGWKLSGCNQLVCSNVKAGGELRDGSQPLSPPALPGAATWLSTIAREPDWTPSTSIVPPNLVYQTVKLKGRGTYVLSWWDQAVSDTGRPTASGSLTKDYPVAVYDSEWRAVASALFQSSASRWSERRTLLVQPLADGVYHVAFAAGRGNEIGTNLAIANVQLEGGGATAAATAYDSNAGSRTKLSANCGVDTPADFRARFDYHCDGGGCYYQLRDALRLDTELLQQGYSPLSGKVANGNYNYRLGSIAVNLVGTGLVDCSKADAPSCSSTGYVEYDLTHSAQNVPMEDYSGRTSCFDFAIGNIHGGKALATERVLSLPLGSADSELISQPLLSKVELVGRPLSGTYSLRIRDTPGLVWGKLRDVQLLVNYNYWSRVTKASGE
jgi:hypothetical protein